MNDDLDLDALQASMGDVLANECPIETVHRHVLSGSDYHEPLWRSISELGWLGLAIPVRHGGLGLGGDALAMLYRELGRALAPVPVLPTLLAAEAITRLGDPGQQERWLPGIAAGHMRAAICDPSLPPAIGARRDGDDLLLDGRVENLLDGSAAELVLLLAELDGRPVFVVIEHDLPGVTVDRFLVADQTRHLAHVSLASVRIGMDHVLDAGAIDAALDALIGHAAIAIASDAIGGAEAILAATIDYLKIREQFGRIIGSFQTLKHRAADHKAALTGAEALVGEVAAGAGAGLASLDALEAKALATSVYLAIARDCVQLHGGIGFTWEHPAHLFLKRAWVDAALFGSVELTLDRVVRGLAA